nr:MAG TPA: hypothetical protein [Caudoviricetes sp.]
MEPKKQVAADIRAVLHLIDGLKLSEHDHMSKLDLKLAKDKLIDMIIFVEEEL